MAARGVAEPVAAAPTSGAVSGGRLTLVVLGLLLYLLGGAVLAGWCFRRGARRPEPPPPAPQAPPEATEEAGRPPITNSRPTVVVSAEEQHRVDLALARGVWFLKDHQLPSGTWSDDKPVGYAALAGLALLECGVPADDPVVQKAAAFVRREVMRNLPAFAVYQYALALLFLDRLGDKTDEELIRRLGLSLVLAQHPGEGAWGYEVVPLDRLDPAAVPQLLERLADEGKPLAEWRKAALKGGDFTPGNWDNSNTQFAVLALWVAGRHGVPIRRTMTLAEKHFRNTQVRGEVPDPRRFNRNLDGSWYYRTQESANDWPTMTCSGLLALAVAHAVDADAGSRPKPLADPDIRRALAMLGREIDRPDEQDFLGQKAEPADRSKRGTSVYFLWSLERVAVLYDLPAVDGKDWYAWGCRQLLPRQRDDGCWRNTRDLEATPVVDTCFALLFLKQANLASDLSAKLRLLSEP